MCSKTVLPFYMSTGSVGEFQFLHVLINAATLSLFHFSHSFGSAVVYHCDFILH